MTRRCAFCEAHAEASIPHGRVCRTHAIEFYTGLLAFAVDPAREIADPADAPMFKRELFVKVTKLPDKPPRRPRRSYVKRSASWSTVQRAAAAGV